MSIPLVLELEPSNIPTGTGYSCLAAVISTTVAAVHDADHANPTNGAGLAGLALHRGVFMRYLKDVKHLDKGFVYLVGHREGDQRMRFVIVDLRGDARIVYDPSDLGTHPLVDPECDFRDHGDNALIIRCLQIENPVRACAD